MTTDERVSSLHERMKALREKRERRKTGAIGAAGAAIAVCIFVLIFGKGTAHFDSPAGMYSGSTLLFEDVGGYVLVAIVSFALAVVITIACIHWRKKKNSQMNQEKGEHKEEDTHEE